MKDIILLLLSEKERKSAAIRLVCVVSIQKLVLFFVKISSSEDFNHHHHIPGVIIHFCYVRRILEYKAMTDETVNEGRMSIKGVLGIRIETGFAVKWKWKEKTKIKGCHSTANI